MRILRSWSATALGRMSEVWYDNYAALLQPPNFFFLFPALGKFFPKCGAVALKFSRAVALMRWCENFSCNNGAVVQGFKKRRMSQWRKLKKVVRTQHYTTQQSLQIPKDSEQAVLKLGNNFYIIIYYCEKVIKKTYRHEAKNHRSGSGSQFG